MKQLTSCLYRMILIFRLEYIFIQSTIMVNLHYSVRVCALAFYLLRNQGWYICVPIWQYVRECVAVISTGTALLG